MSQYRVLCETHGYVFAWSDTLVDTCPIDPADVLDQGATAVVSQLRTVLTSNTPFTATKTSGLARICSVSYSSDEYGPLRKVKLLASADAGVASFDVEVYDRTSNSTLITGNFSNVGEDLQTIDLGYIPTPPSIDSVVDINVKVYAPSNNLTVKISQISFFAG